jgi:hypothetical protein
MKVVLGDGDKLAATNIVSSSLPQVKPALLSTHDFLSTSSSLNTLTSRRASARHPDKTLLSNIRSHQSYEPMSIAHGI